MLHLKWNSKKYFMNNNIPFVFMNNNMPFVLMNNKRLIKNLEIL
jgi:hypothetical protein